MIDKIKKYDLEIVVFICGATVMVFELIGSRVVAPYVGTSIYVWTSLIGVILASLSLGYYFGGRFADTRPSTKPLALIIFISAIAIVFSSLIKDLVPLLVTLFPFYIEVKSLLISIILFAPASFLLGTVSPYAVRLRMKDVEKAGGTSGNLYAVSTFGSIVGTFLAGFYLIPHFGTFFSLILLSIILVLTAIFLLGYEVLRFFSRYFLSILFLSLFFGAFSFSTSVALKEAGLIADINTEYNRIFIMNGVDSITEKPTINLSTDPFGVQASIFINDTDNLVFNYTKFFKIIEFLKPDANSVLMLGGSAYTYPRDFLKNFPKSTIDVVEIDPGMTDVARKYFGLKDDPRMRIFHDDGRIFLNNNKNKYDVIFIDAFNSFSSIPFQLTTIEFVRKNLESLSDNGIVVVNIISAIDGDKGKFLRAEYTTFRKVFPQVYIFALDYPSLGQEVQNLILLATKSEKIINFLGIGADLSLVRYSEKLWTKPIANDVPILTDDFAPVEFYKRTSL